MKDGGGQYRIGLSVGQGSIKMFQIAGPAAGNDRSRHGGGNFPGQVQIIAGQLAVGVHTGQQQFPGPPFHRLHRPFDGINAGGSAAAPGVDFPTGIVVQGQGIVHIVPPGRRAGGRINPLGVKGDDDALAAELGGPGVNQGRAVDSGGVDRYLVRPGVQHPPHILNGADAAADGQGDKHLFRNPLHYGHHRAAGVGAGGDVQKDQFIAALLVVKGGQFRRVAGVPQIDKTGPFHHPPGIHIQAGNNAFGQHRIGNSPGPVKECWRRQYNTV